MAKTEPSPAYLWYPRAALSSALIAELSAAEECWYRRALDRSWLGDGVPADPAKLAVHIGKRCTPKAAQKILDMFFVPHKKTPTKMVNETQEKVRKKFLESQRQKSQAGRRGMEKRWKHDKERTSGDNTVITPPITEHNNQSSFSFPFSSSFSSSDLKRLIDWAISAHAKKDSRLVEIAVIQTLLNRNGSDAPINSGQYFADEIKRMCSKANGITADTIDVVLKRRREQMEGRLGK